MAKVIPSTVPWETRCCSPMVHPPRIEDRVKQVNDYHRVSSAGSAHHTRLSEATAGQPAELSVEQGPMWHANDIALLSAAPVFVLTGPENLAHAIEHTRVCRRALQGPLRPYAAQPISLLSNPCPRETDSICCRKRIPSDLEQVLLHIENALALSKGQ